MKSYTKQKENKTKQDTFRAQTLHVVAIDKQKIKTG